MGRVMSKSIDDLMREMLDGKKGDMSIPVVKPLPMPIDAKSPQ